MKTVNLPINLDIGYHSNEVENPKEVFLLLHGYMLDGKFMFDVLKQYLPEDALIISPNGPFLIPQKKDDGFRACYSWYFFDPIKKSFYVNFEPAANMLSSLLETVSPDLPVTVIGYSQGGYIAPKVAELNDNIKRVIGLACIFRNDRFKERDIEYHQIHSKTDIVVSFEDSYAEFEQLKHNGQYIQLDNEGHKLNTTYFRALKTIL